MGNKTILFANFTTNDNNEKTNNNSVVSCVFAIINIGWLLILSSIYIRVTCSIWMFMACLCIFVVMLHLQGNPITQGFHQAHYCITRLIISADMMRIKERKRDYPN